jgi:hypothetical protein
MSNYVLTNNFGLTFLQLGNDVVKSLDLQLVHDPNWPDMNSVFTKVTSKFSQVKPIWYPLKIFASEIDDNLIDCNDIGYYVVVWTTGECRYVLDANRRNLNNDLVGKTVFSIKEDVDLDEFVGGVVYAPSVYLTEDSLHKLQNYVYGLSDIINVAIVNYTKSNTISYNGVE